MEKINNFKKETILSPEIKDLFERCDFALPHPGYSFGLESDTNEQISLSIKNQEYDTIIAEDASGRLPGLLIYEAIKKFYAKKNQNSNVNLFFMAGSKNVDNVKEKESKRYGWGWRNG